MGIKVGKYEHHDGCDCSVCITASDHARGAVFDAAMALAKYEASPITDHTEWGRLYVKLINACHQYEEVERG